MKFFILPVPWLLASMVCIGCATPQSGAPSEYRRWDNPIDSYTTIYQTTSESNKHYLEWQANHDRLEDSIDRGTLALRESQRKTLQSLENLRLCCRPEIAKELLRYPSIYEDLLREAETGAPPRMLLYKYQNLKTEILQVLEK